MKRTHLFLFCMTLILPLLVPGVVRGQAWKGVIDPSRATDWSTPGVSGGIPPRTTICTTLGVAGQLPTFVQSVTASQINSAIASCPAGQTVFLNPGTYNTGGVVTFKGTNNVTLRGSGANQTIINASNGSCGLLADFCIWSGDFSDRDHVENSANWTAGYAKGTSVITLSSTTNLQVGNFINLDQLDDATDGYPTVGGIYVCTGAGGCTGQGGESSARSGRGQMQQARVVAINGNQVTISPPLFMPNWRSSQTPQAWWPNTVIKGDGIENMAILSQTGNQCSTCANIVLFNAMDCWVKGVVSSEPNPTGGVPVASHMWLDNSMGITIRDSYFYGSNNSSQSYGVELFPSQQDLIENNIFQHVTAPTVNNGPSGGNVIAYNFAIDDNFTAGGNSPSWMDPMSTDHEIGETMDLYEGNQGLGYQGDNIHGTHHFQTFFRNQYYGDMWNNPVKAANTEILHLWAYNRFFNIIGNVLGRAGYYTDYQNGDATSIFNVQGGPDGENGESGANDTYTTSTLMRWGNYDTVNNAARFVSSEVPSGIPNYANPVPASQNLPASFYLSSKPAWFGTIPWPPIGPDVTGGNMPGVAGHANMIPAQTCWLTIMGGVMGSSGLLSFNANTCYNTAATQAPAPPTNVHAVPQ